MNTMSIRSQMKRYLLVTACGLGLAACASAKPATNGEMSELAKGAPPPPDGAAKPLERKVTTEASADFKAAVAFYQDKAKKGMTNDDCIAVAEKFDDVGSDHDKLPEAFFNAGAAYQACHMNKEAEAEYQKALKVNPSHAPSLANLGEIYFEGGNESRATDYFNKAQAADGTIGAPYVSLAWISYRKMQAATTPAESKKWEDEAIINLKNALAVDNDSVQARVLMALVFMEGSDKNKNRLDIASLLLDGVAKNKPTLKDKATDEEKAQFERETARWEENQRYPLLYNAKGLLYMKRGNVGEALKQFRRAVELDPKLVEAHMNLGLTVLGFRKYDEAESTFRTVLKLDPRNYDAMNGLGMSLRGGGKIDEAEKAYNDAIALAKDRGAAYFNLGVLYMDFRTNDTNMDKNLGAYQKAKHYFEDFLTKSDVSADRRKEATDNIADCDKGVATIQKIEAQNAAQPPEPAPAAPAAGQK
jgi:tetratricopeptide (TPR) repeat protein